MIPNLVLIHSFPTNSVILKGLIEYLSDYFHVHFIDLPGFNDNYDGIKPVSFKYFSDYVKNYINDLFLDNYWIGGISFGFIIANACAKDKKCQGVIAIEPYLNSNTLNINFLSKFIWKIMLDMICTLNLHKMVWDNRLFAFFLKRFIMPSEPLFILTYRLIHPYVFFETAKLILNYNNSLLPTNSQNILIINEQDDTIDTNMVLNQFKKYCRNLLIVNTSSEHYPSNITKEYFERHIKKEDIYKILKYINKLNN